MNSEVKMINYSKQLWKRPKNGGSNMVMLKIFLKLKFLKRTISVILMVTTLLVQFVTKESAVHAIQ